ncbi:tripartite ATP-independent transporter DctP family solute receptor [Brevibacterium sanguinis]|uniref:Tripartite ATP-independent transporter DctP family solute receptor n=2 Tax=Brevibacterium TaxID=1696 RepID=A0A366IHJ5_9MICO|nr:MULTISPECIES: DctP family TRAP transporter solute-binding subunit [Brevibacterium]RBP65060.1 tripartite ATP-independent transporter DctP family solute receptor [Brevibacterium sanguinis]RBP71323.1 tripartite ATP-independent transporter DctP family solute receptor [Brevibacterium celere]
MPQAIRRTHVLTACAVLTILVMLLTGCGTNFGTTEDGQKRYRWKMTVTTGSTSTWYLAATKFAEDLEKETDGRITLKVFGSERLSAGEATAGVEQLMDGAKDFSYNSPIIYAGVDPRFGAVTAPFRFDTVEDGQAALAGPGGDVYRKYLAERGVELLGFGESGMRQLTNTRRPIETPEDLAGLKFRIPGFGLYTDFYRSLGANPTTMPFGEVFSALQQGAIDGQENPIDVIHSANLQEVQPYLTLWNYSYDPLILGMNKDLFESLSDSDKELVARLAADANEFQISQNREREEKLLAELKDKGMEVNELTDEQKEAFRTSLAPRFEEYRTIWGPEMAQVFIPEGL